MPPRLKFWPVLLPLAAAALAVARWWAQGSGNLYSDPAKRFYVPHEDLGWRLISDGPLWLGLDAVAAIIGVAGVVAVAIWLLRRLEQRRGRSFAARAVVWLVAAVPLAVPSVALFSGSRPSGGRDLLPQSELTVASGIDARLPGVAGRYHLLDHPTVALVARISAGGETFEARFASRIAGYFSGDPSDLEQPMSARFTASAGAVDTGIELRSRHAREYLQTETYPEVVLNLDRLEGAEQVSAAELAFEAHGTLGFMGGAQPVQMQGTLRYLDAAARARLGINVKHALLLKATFTLDLEQTPIKADLGDFDSALIPVQARLLLGLQTTVESPSDRTAPAASP